MFMKHCSQHYRNDVKGVKWEQYTDNPGDFETAKESAKKIGKRTKRIKNRLYIEV